MIEQTEKRTYYAARVHDDTDSDSPEHLVVVPAADELDARRESGLIEAEFHEAHDDELDEWDAICSSALTDIDLHVLVKSVRKLQVGMANQFARDRGFGAEGEGEIAEARRRKARYKARKLAQLRGKLELMLLEPAEDDDGEPFVEEGP